MKTSLYLPPIFIFTLLSLSLQAQVKLSGTVTTEGFPAQGATVRIAELHRQTLTGNKGDFLFADIPAGLYTITANYIGCNMHEQKLFIDSSAFTLNIALSKTDNKLEEVVVTGVFKGLLVKENPVAITSVSLKKIDQSVETNIIDALVKNVPGLNVVKTGPNVSKPFIRGLGYNRVLTLYDGIRQEGQQWGDEHSIEVDGYNIEKAEVIKGPASLMYGSDALAGVVSLYPQKPESADSKLHGRIVSEYQSNNNLIGNGVQVNYNNGRFSFALTGSARYAKNYRNALEGRVYNTGFREKSFSVFTGYTTKAGYSHLRYTYYNNQQGIPDGSRDSLTRKFTYQQFEAGEDTVSKRPLADDAMLNSYRLSPLHQHIAHQRLYTHHYYKAGNGSIDVLLGLQQNTRKEYNHPTVPDKPGMFVKLNTINYGIRYNTPKISGFETAIGINGMLQTNSSIDATDFPIPDYQLKDAGLFIYTKWKKEKLTVSGGIRYDVRKINWENFYVKNNPLSGFDGKVTGADTMGATLQFPAYNKTFHGVSASAGFTLQLSNKLNLKINVGRGYRSPNITEMASNGLDPGAHIIYLGNRNFKPEFSLQEDVGLNFNSTNLSAELSVFNNHIKNYIYLSLLADENGNAITDAQGNKTYQYRQSSAWLYGAEFFASFHPRYIKGFVFDNSLSVVYGINTDEAVKGKGIQGAYLPLMPPLKWQSTIMQKIETGHALITTVSVKAELEYVATQNRYLGLNNTETKTPGYTLLNAGLHTTIQYSKAKSLQLYLIANNLLNNTYQSHLSRLKYFEYYTASPAGTFGMYNMGRNVCIKLVLPF
ncbi:TonB-dependent receptor [Panacibacter sp. DH6]|uniref:TonB-dependent receptor n=1 Tax=Panacibacter microcysteis TaxID=2793269 RepID=A0A931E966_9BACT|nr:TonB-dependent receptor [Panacibacter microcysteis]MBG9377615.1 TonB-dependent receptor [Panacibacter microcysteis]